MSLAARLAAMPYGAYSYSYPHKTAYRPLAMPQPLAPLWAAEKRDALFLYVHIPFCEMRCGFCNLFTIAKPQADLPRQYIQQLLRQMETVAAALGEHRMVRFAVGGGTPTYLDVDALEALFTGVTRHFNLDLQVTPTSVEVSPATVNTDKLQLLKRFGVDRVSIGVQSFFAAETDVLIRPQAQRTLEGALQLIRDTGFTTLNLDLIYGIPGQTQASFAASLREAIRWRPEEIYLYPLYVRPLTGLGIIDVRQGSATTSKGDARAGLYQTGRDLLLAAGYEQQSMRMFSLPSGIGKPAPVYCCQEDGMLGLGSGARSYTHALHYSTEYAVGRQSTREIIEAYNQRPAEFFEQAHYGMVLDQSERKHRYVIQSLLSRPGLDLTSYGLRFAGAEALADFPLLPQLLAENLAVADGPLLSLTAAGLALSDGIGPALISEAVQQRMDGFVLA